MKFPLVETVTTVCCVAILGGLGTWQMQRLHWKNDIIEKLNTQYEAAGKAQTLSPAQLSDIATQDTPLLYGAVHGKLLREKAILLGPRTEDGRRGYHLLVPMALPDEKILIVNTGWVDDLWKDDMRERLAVLPMDITARGILRKPDWSSFTSKNSPDNDMWFRADIDEIAATKELDHPYPFILYADKETPELYDVSPHEEKWLPRNKHLQYALFWYAMGVVMLGVYGFYVFGKNKPASPPSITS